MKVDVLGTERDTDYSEYIERHEGSLFNSTLLFRDFIRTLCPDAVPYYFAALNGDGKIIGVLPSFLKKGPLGPVLNSMPWFGSNPGVLADSPEALFALLQAFDNTAKWTGCFSSTLISPPNQDQEPYEAFYSDKETFPSQRRGLITEIPLFKEPQQFADALMGKVHQKTRNQIRKSVTTCMVYETYTPEDWEFLKATHRENMEAVGAPVKDQEFDIIQKHFKKGYDYKLYIAMTDDGNAERVAALLVEYYNKTVEYITPVIVDKYRHLCPMHLLIFSAMGDAAQKGYRYWNWGGTKIPGQEGVYQFKKRFGARESEYTYYTQVYKELALDVTPKWLAENYPYFYVLPYDLLRRD